MMKTSSYHVKHKNNNFVLDTPVIEFKTNQINCLIGDNGCGKSTLLKAIINDNKNKDLSSKIMLLQKPYIFSGSVLENLKIIKKLNPDSTIDYLELVNLLKLEDLLNDNAKLLSGGQRQRLAFAMVILSDKQLVLLDEPFNNIDVKSQKLMIDVMKKYKKTYVLANHKLGLSKKIGNYFFLMENGQLIAEGDEEIFSKNLKIKELMEME